MEHDRFVLGRGGWRVYRKFEACRETESCSHDPGNSAVQAAERSSHQAFNRKAEEQEGNSVLLPILI